MEEKKLLFTVILASLLFVLSLVDASEVKQTDKANEKLWTWRSFRHRLRI